MKGLKKLMAVSLILVLTMGEFGGGLSVTARAAEISDEIIITDSMEDNIGDETSEQETSEDITIEDVVIEDEDTSLDIAEEDVIVDESEEDALEDASFDASSVDDPESGTSFDTLSEKEKNNSNIDYIKNGVTYYKLWVGDTQVSSDNRKNIPSITNGSASFEPSTNTLYFSTVQKIRGTYTPSGYSVPCVIYAEIPLTISGFADISGGNENVMGIAVRKTNLSIKGKLSIYDAKYGIYVDNGNVNLGSDDGNTNVYIRNTTYALMGRGGEINFGPGDYEFQGTYGIKAEGSNINFNQGRVTANGEKYAIASRWEDKFIFGTKTMLMEPFGGKDDIVKDGNVYLRTFFDKDGNIARKVIVEGKGDYDLWVGSTLVTYENKDNIEAVTGGTAKYDPYTRTLTFTGNVNDIIGIHKDNDYINHNSLIYSKYDLTVKGNLTESCGSDTYGIVVREGNLTLDGNINIKSENMACFRASGDLTIKGNVVARSEKYDAIDVFGKIYINGTVNAFSKGNALYGYKGVKIGLGSFVEAESSDTKAISSPGGIVIYDDGMVIKEPKGGKISNDGTYIAEADGETGAKKVKITEKDHTVTYNFNGAPGATNKTVQVEHGGKASNLSSDSAYYVVTGWYTDSACTKAYNFSNAVTANLTLYAKWVEAYGLYVGSTLVSKDNKDNIPGILGGGSAKYDPDTKTLTFSGNVTGVTGKTIDKWKEYNLIYSLKDLIVKGKASFTNKNIYGITVEEGDLTLDGDFDFCGTGEKGCIYAVGNVYVSGSLTGNSEWIFMQSRDNSVIFNGKVNVSTTGFQCIDAEKNIVLESGNIEVQCAQDSTSKAFVASNGIILGTGMVITLPEGGGLSGDKTYIVDENGKAANHVKVQKQLQKYTVKFDLNGVLGTAPATQTVLEGDKAKQPTDPAVLGYEFLGWYKEKECKNKFVFSTVITQDTTIYAKWRNLPLVAEPIASAKTGSKVVEGTEVTLSTSSYEADIFYTTDGSTPSINKNGKPTGTTKVYGKALTITKNITIKALAYKKGMRPSSVVTFKYTINKDSWGDIADTAKTSEELATIIKGWFDNDSGKVPAGVWYIFKTGTGADGKATYKYMTEAGNTGISKNYTGNNITFNSGIILYDGKSKLLEGRDYTIAYTNNLKAAKETASKAPTVTLTGKGAYGSSKAFKFTIAAIKITEAKLTSESTVKVVVDKTKMLGDIKPTLSYKGKELTADTDYTLKYYNGSAVKDDKLIKTPAKTALSTKNKTYTIQITGKGNFKSTFGTLVNVNTVASSTKIVLVSSLTVTNSSGKAITTKYTGKAINVQSLFSGDKPVAVVKDGDTKLEYGKDYTVEKTSNTAAGKYNFKITGTNDSTRTKQYVGELICTYEITGTALSKVKIAGMKTSVGYTGKAITIKNLYKQDDVCKTEKWTAVTLYTESSGKKKALKKDTDYTISMSNTGALGSFNVVFTGKGKYTGTLSKKVTIKAASLAKYTVTVADAVYSKAGAKPTVTVKNGSVKLINGMDYTVTYFNNTGVCVDKTAEKAPYVVIKGIGNYSGQIDKTPFIIKKASISKVKVVTTDVPYSKSGKVGYFLIKPKLYDGNEEITMGSGKDIEKPTYTYAYQVDTKLEDGTIKKAGATVAKTDKVPIGTTISVAVSVKCGSNSPYEAKDSSGNAIDMLIGYYKVIKSSQSIANAKVSLSATGQAKLETRPNDSVNLTKGDLVVTVGTSNLGIGEYDITSVTTDKSARTVTVKLAGRGQYGGTCTAVFDLTTRNLIVEN